jgi:hypothetical protein
VDGDLAEDVGGGAEAVEADPLGLADQAQRSVADQPGAEQRRRLDVLIVAEDRETEALVGDGQLGIAAVDVVAGEAAVVTEVLPALPAVAAFAVGPAEPGDADALAELEALRPVPSIWWPGTSGSFGSLSSPSRMWRSVRQTPQAETAISTCPGPGEGSGNCVARSGSPARSRTIARIVGSLRGHHGRATRHRNGSVLLKCEGLSKWYPIEGGGETRRCPLIRRSDGPGPKRRRAR